MALNFELLGDAGAPVTNYLQGQQDVVRNQLAQQQFETGRIGQETSRLTQDKMRMEMDAFKRRQAGLDQFMQKAKDLGVDGDPEQLTKIFYEHALTTGDPEQVRAAGIAVQTARERKNYEAGLNPAAAAPTPSGNFANFPNAREIAPGDGPMVSRMPAPVPLAPAAQGDEGTPVLTGNALTPTPNRLAQIDKRLLELRRFPTAGEKERAELTKERDRLMTRLNVVAGGSVYNPATGEFDQAPEKTLTSVDATTMKALGYPLTPEGFAAFKDAQRQERLLTKAEEDQKIRIAAAGRTPAAAKDDPNTTVASTQVDNAGNVTFYNKFGKPINTQKGAGKPSATFEKTAAAKVNLARDLDQAIAELTAVTKDGGLIDQSTGSGVGRAVDVGARFFGKAMPGDIAIGKLQPVADLALKMVPRFEGPQSNADTTSYKQAAGQLADPTLPPEIRKAAGKTVLRLMIARKGQFTTADIPTEGAGAAPTGGDEWKVVK